MVYILRTYCSFGQSGFLILWLKHTTYFFLSNYNSSYIICTCKKREVTSFRNPPETRFSVRRREPRHVARPDLDFATCRNIARILTAMMSLASSQKYKMQQLLESRTFSMISSQYKMKRGVVHVQCSAGVRCS